MLRIGMPAQPAVPEEEEPVAPEVAEVPEAEIPEMAEMPMMDKFDAQKVSPEVARYLEPGSTCDTCEFFHENTCLVVRGPIDPKGVCMLFTPMDLGSAAPEEEEAPVEEELPVPEAVDEEQAQ